MNVIRSVKRPVKDVDYGFVGDFEGERNGRYFTDFTEDKFNKFVQNIENIKLKEVWITYDVRPGRGGEKWLNLILQKN